MGIQIAPYNSKANGKIERGHWDLRHALVKMCGPDNLGKWFYFLPHVLWADRITTRRLTGCSPFFMITGAHPIIPLDIVEATWLIHPPDGPMTRAELLAFRAKALAKHQIHIGDMRDRISKEKRQRLLKFEEEHAATIRDYNFKPGDLVLIRNTMIEKHLNKKTKLRYRGPMIVIKRTQGGRYIVAEMDGTVLHGRFAQFRVIPYFARESIELPKDIHEVIDITAKKLEELANAGPVYGDRIKHVAADNPTMGHVKFRQAEKEQDDSGSEASEGSDEPSEADTESDGEG